MADVKPCAYLIPTSTATNQMVCVKIGCIRREPQPVSQKNRGIRAEGLSPVCTPPPAGGGKINTKFTKSGPVISPTAVKELLSAQSNGNQPGTLPLPCPRELRSRCCWGHPARTDQTQSATNGTFSASFVIGTNNIPPQPKASQR